MRTVNEDAAGEDADGEGAVGEYPESKSAARHHCFYCSHPTGFLQHYSAELMASHDSQLHDVQFRIPVP